MTSARRGWLLCVGIGVAAALAQTLFVKRYGSDVPLADEWNVILPVLARINAGAFTWSLLTEQLNETRMPLPRAIFFGLFWLLGEWSPLSYMLVSALVVGIIAAVWAYTLDKLGLPIWLSVLSAALLASPMQWENILWGMEVVYYLGVLGTVVGVCLMALPGAPRWPHVLGAILGCLVASGSMIAALLSWPAVGVCLALRLLGEGSWRAALPKLGAFGGAGLVCVGLYMWGYTFIEQRAGPGIAGMLAWIVTALEYPATLRVSLSGSPSARSMLLQWVPIVAAALLYVRSRREQASRGKLVLVVGLLLFVLPWIVLAATARAVAPAVAPRYGTVLVWLNILALLTIVDLLRAARGRGVWGALASGALGVLGAWLLLVQVQRWEFNVGVMQAERVQRALYHDTVRRYLNDPAPTRALDGPVPFPAEYLAPKLDDPALRAVLPPGLTAPPLEGLISERSGDAWSPDGLFPTVPDDRQAWGSWGGDDARTGQLVLGPFVVRQGVLALPIAGNPSRAGNSIVIEAIDSGQRVVYAGGDPFVRWRIWYADVSELMGRRVQIVAVDGNDQNGGWLGLGQPRPMSHAMAWQTWLIEHFEALVAGAAAVALMLGAATGLLDRTPTARTIATRHTENYAHEPQPNPRS